MQLAEQQHLQQHQEQLRVQLQAFFNILVNKHMNLLEMFEDQKGHRTEKDDNTPLKLSDVRKTKVTLRQLNRLRIMNDVRKLENEQKLETVRTQYATPVESETAM
jgi:hypothetical protein